MTLIYAYTREKALQDGELVAAGEMAREAGLLFHTALTRAAWEAVVATSAEDAEHGQSEEGRLWDVLWGLAHTLRLRHRQRARHHNEAAFEVSVWSGGRSKVHQLKVVCGPGDDMEAVLTVMLPGED